MSGEGRTVLTADHVRARRQKDSLVLSRVDAEVRRRAAELAKAHLDVAAAHVGCMRGALDGALDTIPVAARDRKIAAGLRKLVDDRCDFQAESELDPVQARAQLFTEAARARRQASAENGFDAEAVLSKVAQELGSSTDALQRALYADLREQHVLRGFSATRPERLVDEWELAQAQAVLLKATYVTATVHAASAAAYRELFRKLKFRRLLYTIHALREGGYRLEIDGPMSLFASSTKYGLALALVLPIIRACERWQLEAEVLWGKQRDRLQFRLEGQAAPSEDSEARLPEEVQVLLERFRSLDTPWQAEPADAILALPGEGLCVPDLRFVHRETGEVAWLEVMGFWSREAVFRRVDLVRAGLPETVIFAVSTRLRVSEAVLDDDLPAALHVYKGVISAARIAEQLDALAARPLLTAARVPPT